MVEQIEITNNENMKEDDELEKLLGEIPHATSSLTNLNNHHVNDNGYDLYNPNNNGIMYGMYHDNSSSSDQSNASFSSFFSKQDDHDPTPKSHILFRSYSSISPNSCVGKKIDESLGANRIDFSKPFSDYAVVEPHFSRSHMFKKEMSPFYGFSQSCMQIPACGAENLFPQSNLLNIRYPVSYQRGIPAFDLAVSNGLYRQSIGVQRNSHNVPFEGLEGSEESLIVQGERVNRMRNKVNESFRGQNKKCNHSQFAGACENGRITSGNRSFSTPIRCNTLADVKGHVYMFAKDQNGCRFIQSVFDVENQQHVKMVFDEINGHVSELMVNSFGNYLMQKLLEVCSEEQRMCILMEITREPRELVHISLNTHG